MHFVHEVNYKAAEGFYQAVIEIPAGTLEKWQTGWDTGTFYHDEKDGKPRVINFLPYPFNYGFVPQTVLSKDQGGDGDPLDILVLSATHPKGTIAPVKIIGAIQLFERGETDTKIIALEDQSSFAGIEELSELLFQYPGVVEIIRLWFEGYKGPGAFLFGGYLNRVEAESLIERAHVEWLQAVNE